jgi:hypothetical protein
MSNFVPMVLKDHANVDVTFSPRGITNGVATAVKSTGVPAADATFTVEVKQTVAGKRKVDLNFSLPVVQDMVVNGISKPTRVRTAYGKLTLVFDSASNTNERKDLRMALVSALQNADVIIPAIDDLSYPFG